MTKNATPSREAEVLASEQMRDRIADYLHDSAIACGPGAGGGKVYRALLAIEKVVRAAPGQVAHALDAPDPGKLIYIPGLNRHSRGGR